MNTFGRIFRISLYGESHGKEIGVVIDGCPPGLSLGISDFENDMNRRKSGVEGTTARTEEDRPDIKSGIYNGKTTGAPIAIAFKNEDVRRSDYVDLKEHPRPGHADFVAQKKFKSFNDPNGGGMFSGRMTVAMVAAGVVARKIIYPICPVAKLIQVGPKDQKDALKLAGEKGDSIGGRISCMVEDVPIGLGEPFFDSLESCLSHMIFSIPGIRGIEFGSGFGCIDMVGSSSNDSIINEQGKTDSNHSGGINGGISNGNPLFFQVAVKPTSSIRKSQNTFNFGTGRMEQLEIRGRHDICFALRVPPIVEAATSIVLADLLMIDGLYCDRDF